LKDYDLVASPAYIVLTAADEFRRKTGRGHELWQSDFTYLNQDRDHRGQGPAPATAAVGQWALLPGRGPEAVP